MFEVPPAQEMAQVCRSGHLVRVKYLLEYGVRADGSEGARTYLSLACEHGRLEVVVALLRAGARASQADLVHAVRSGSVPTAGRILDELELMKIEHDFWAADRPLLCDPTFLAAAEEPMIRFLLDHGADPSDRDRNGKDAAAVAEKAGASDAVKALLRRG